MTEVYMSVLVLGTVGFFFALLLAFLSRKLYVKEDVRVAEVLKVLPGLNCGACGFSGCRAYAEAVVRECKIFNGCLPGGDELNAQVSGLLGLVGCVSGDKRVVVCRCQADSSQKKTSHRYSGPATCRAADITGGALDCTWGCLAFGDCVEVCPTDALRLANGRIIVDIAKCIACGRCVRICPRNLFELVPLTADTGLYYVACSNKEKALNVKKVCSRGCIACGLCVKVPDSPYILKENLSRIDRKHATVKAPLEEGKNKCPTRCIDSIEIPQKVESRR